MPRRIEMKPGGPTETSLPTREIGYSDDQLAVRCEPARKHGHSSRRVAEMFQHLVQKHQIESAGRVHGLKPARRNLKLVLLARDMSRGFRPLAARHTPTPLAQHCEHQAVATSQLKRRTRDCKKLHPLPDPPAIQNP